MTVTLEWLGVATFRMTVGDTVIFLDAYLERVTAAPPVGITLAEIDRADWVLVGHAHFDHVAGAERIAAQTGARVVGSHETCRVLSEAGVPDGQLIPVAGGEPLQLAPDITMRVFPSQHSCVWASGLTLDPTEECFGDLGVMLDERNARMQTAFTTGGPLAGEDIAAVLAHVQQSVGSRSDGGALAFLIETPDGSVLWKDTSGHWTGIVEKLRPDVAILAAAGRATVDGEPVQGSLTGFIAAEAAALQCRTVVLCHHDDWLPPCTRPVETAPFRAALPSGIELVEMGYLSPTRVLP